ncbi:inactive dipeptidyl peptidase 10-like [Bacillus rossius redtenbacheri]|uniref:inactive dipeptidyl peptidase 10-like n=1 Tax=Bacillus rossius redtenbacheri TaxID=93214 RepID=UPI002FDD6F3D
MSEGSEDSSEEVSPAEERVKPSKRVVTILLPTEELVAASPKQMNWRGILIALLVIVAVLGLIVFSIVLLSPPDEGPRVKGRKFSLQDVLGPLFRAPPFNGTWVSGSELVFRDAHGGVSLLSAENLTTRVLVSNATLRQLNAVDFKISSDLKFALLISDVQKVHKYSFLARYSLYEMETRNRYPLGDARADPAPLLQLAVWAPRGDALAFVRDNDLYYRPRAKAAARRLTASGAPGRVFNGVPDWLYEVEVLKTAGATWFSPDGRYLLYASFNDSLVGEVKYPSYGGAETRPRYPKMRSLRYPKTGTTNPAVTLRVVDLSLPEDSEHADLKPPASIGHTLDHYFTTVKWVSAHRAAVVWMNRRQNLSVISVCGEPLWACEETHAERWGEAGWADAGVGAPLFSADGRAYVALLPVLDADNGRFSHACLVDVASRQATALTHGAYQLTRLVAWDEERDKLYFLAAPERLPGQRHLYRLGDLNSTDQTPECLTCPVPQAPATPGSPPRSNETGEAWPGAWPGAGPEAGSRPACLYSDVHVSPGPSPRYLVLECLGPDTPTAELLDLVTGARLAVLDRRDQLRHRYLAMALPQVKTFQVEVSGGHQAQVRLLLPPGLREHEQMSFPLLLHACAAPGSQLVSERWAVHWGTYLASARNFIVAQVDGRGSGFQGERLMHQLRHRLGSVEVDDQVAVIRYLRDNLDFVDKQKIAVWGWGYGGFTTTMILAEDQEVFKCGIAVAPITNWLHYDSAYTERYMGLPNSTDNYLGYERADATRRAASLRGRRLLLAHGTADDQVPLQQGMLLARALAEQGALFRQLTYPDEGHTFSGVQNHLYKAMEAFLDDCFGPLDFEEWEVGTSFFSFKQ